MFFRDITGDRIPELCATVSYGFGLIDSRVQVYDLTADKIYEPERRGTCNYCLWVDGQRLMAQVTSYATGESLGTGELCIDAGTGQLCLFTEAA